jgi:HSP20 family molecular chaperone IbpA
VAPIEISESEKEVQVTAERPSLEEKDIEVELEKGVLAIRGEKKPRRRIRTLAPPTWTFAPDNATKRVPSWTAR